MEALLDGLGTWEFREANREIDLFGEVSGVTEADLLAILNRVPPLRAQYPADYTIEAEGEKITWLNYESLLWTLGEAFRRLLQRQPLLPRSARLWEQVEAICLDPSYGKGRESFTMLLGQYGGRPRVPVLLRLMDDPEIQGHALYALRLLGAPDALARARELLESSRSWVRGEARKYLAKLG